MEKGVLLYLSMTHLWYISYSSSKQCTCTYFVCAGVFHLKTKKISLLLSLSFPFLVSHSHFPILPSRFLCFQYGKCSITPTITMALYVSQNKVGLSLYLPFSVPLFANYSTQSHTPNAGLTIIELILSALTQTLCFLFPIFYLQQFLVFCLSPVLSFCLFHNKEYYALFGTGN